MPDLEMTRSLPAPPARVFEAISRPDIVVQWWGPEGFRIDEGAALDFSAEGPWMSVMIAPDGRRFKVSGHVTHVTRGVSIGFTWAWHDENDHRGPESHVTLSLAPEGEDRTELRLSHRELETEEAVKSHGEGWASTLNKLEQSMQT